MSFGIPPIGNQSRVVTLPSSYFDRERRCPLDRDPFTKPARLGLVFLCMAIAVAAWLRFCETLHLPSITLEFTPFKTESS